MELSATNIVIWDDEVEVQQPDGLRRTPKGKEQVDLCWYEDAKQILDLANQVAPGFQLVLVHASKQTVLDPAKPDAAWTLDLTINSSTGGVIANNEPGMGDAAAENATYLYKKEGCAKAFHIVNTGKGLDVWCGRMWRAWTGQQGMVIKNGTLVWA